jgi:phosphotransferase system HPr-like phosphotransfer protein
MALSFLLTFPICNLAEQENIHTIFFGCAHKMVVIKIIDRQLKWSAAGEKDEAQMKTYIMLPEKMEPRKIQNMVYKANEFEQCQIFIEYNDIRLNAKSLLSMSLLNGAEGMCCLHANGKDSREALETMRTVCTSIF